jgi:hypothetical protein
LWNGQAHREGKLVSPDRKGIIGEPGQHLPRHRRRLRGRAAVAAVLLLVLMASPAAADPCAVTDPECLTDTVKETVDAVEKTVGSAEETVDEAAEEVSQTVDETGAEVVGQVGTVIDGLLGKGGKPDPGGRGDGKDEPEAGRPAGRGGRHEPGPVTGRVEPRDPSVTTFPTQGTVSRGPVASPPGADRAGGTIGAAAKQLAFPALLAMLVLAFLVIQNRMDRKDPRLASAPLGPELLTFE